MITLDCSDSRRVRMSCGHVIGPESLRSYAENQIKRGEYEIKCPHVNECGMADCGHVWDYGNVRGVAELTTKQQQDFEQRLSINFLHRTSGMQKCAGCMSWCCRDDLTNNCVRCVLCSANNGQSYDFCWLCLRQWRNVGTAGHCGNDGCESERQRILRHLATCPMKTIDDVQCPAVRACPRCSTLLEHSEMCKHVQCTACCFRFCFICLKEENPDDAGRLLPGKCGAPWGCKKVAARQTQLASLTHIKQ